MIGPATERFLAGAGLSGSRCSPVSGGDSCRAYRVDADRGRYFLKHQPTAPEGFFAAEADGLAALASTRALRVPTVIARDRAHLLLEWLALAAGGDDRALGAGLARLHAADRERFGWSRDNFLGRTPQRNVPLPAETAAAGDGWARFFAEARLAPCVERLADRHPSLGRAGRELLAAVPDLLGDHRPHAALIHGDLWGGNAAFLESGEPVLFDPAVHCADRECDLAMMRLFGGFSARCFEAYEARLPSLPGAERRRPLYQLYHVLNHAILFDGPWVERSERLVTDLLTGLPGI